MKKNKVLGFTLLEVIIAMTSFFLLLTVIINIYSKMIKLKYNIQARTNILQDAYFAIEKIDLMLKDYTIDYEEYFNRKNVGCNTATTGRNVGNNGYCNLFTTYGNGNNSINNTGNHNIYYCTSKDVSNEETKSVFHGDNVVEGGGCEQLGQQSFGQYAWQFRDVKNNADRIPSAVGDDDDENIMKGPSAIDDATHVKELYLIAQDGKSRIFIRRALIESGDWNNNGITGDTDSEKLYTLQILKLKGFDAGSNHNFDINTSSGVYDGKIDTRACDYAQGFICKGPGVGTIYEKYKLPQDENDGWVNLFQKNITISDRNLMIYPSKNPQYALAEDNVQINPYFTINFTSKLYGKIRQKRLGIQDINTFQINLQTTFNTKNFYTK